MKNLKLYALALIFVLILSSPAFALETETSINIAINGHLVYIPGQQVSENTIIVPAAIIADCMNINIRQDKNDYNKAVFTQGNTEVIATVGRNDISVNGTEIILNQEVKAVDDTLMVPLRFFEYFGAEVVWDPVYKVAHLFPPNTDEASKNKIIQTIKKGFDPECSYLISLSPESTWYYRKNSVTIQFLLRNISGKSDYRITSLEVGYKGKTVYRNNKLSIKQGKAQIIAMELAGNLKDLILDFKVK